METLPQSQALKFYSSIRLLVQVQHRYQNLQKQDCVRVRIRIVKNKFAPPFRQVDVDIVAGTGYVVESATKETL